MSVSFGWSPILTKACVCESIDSTPTSSATTDAGCDSVGFDLSDHSCSNALEITNAPVRVTPTDYMVVSNPSTLQL